ncbi:MAG TPA: helix-hairpin-helix domain-containing protein [Thermomicrobiales bacterium]|nr:helix-hairpin-helix domain-containing protein [Thermomicrobiales bacterium]
MPGVGPKRKKALIRKFGSVKGIREASAEELTTVDGINAQLAENIKANL